MFGESEEPIIVSGWIRASCERSSSDSHITHVAFGTRSHRLSHE